MKRGFLTVSLLLLAFGGAFGATADKSRKLNYFPIGAYCVDPGSDVHFKALREAGFNTVQSYAGDIVRQRALLDKAQQYDMKVMLNLHVDFLRKGPKGLTEMLEVVRALKDHPALGFWYLYDEPDGKKVNPRSMRPFYEALKRETPRIPVAVACCWTEDWHQYSDVLDIQMVDHYPVKDQLFPAAPVQEMTTFVKQAIALGKPVLPVVQIFNWQTCQDQLGNLFDKSKLRYPNAEELRYSIWSSMAQGVMGMYSFAIHAPLQEPAGRDWWNFVAAGMFRELRDFVALAESPEAPEIFARADDANYLAATFVNKARNKRYFLLVNHWPLERPFVKCYLDGKYQERDYHLRPWGNTRKVEGELKKGQLRIKGSAAPWEVFIWEIDLKEVEK